MIQYQMVAFALGGQAFKDSKDLISRVFLEGYHHGMADAQAAGSVDLC